MLLYTLNENLLPDEIVEGYESLIWTERQTAWGDFEIVFPDSREFRNRLAPGVMLGLDKSYRTMKVETVDISSDDDGGKTLKVEGRSLEAWLDDRPGMPTLAPLATSPKWELTGKPADIVRRMFTEICVTPTIETSDRLPFHKAGSLLPLGTIPEPQDSVTVALDPDTLYNSIKKLCDMYGLGFRIVRAPRAVHLYFEVYTGNDLTAGQTAKPAVVFSPRLDNLTSTSQITSDAGIKNVAYVYGKNGVATVYSPGANIDTDGFDRRVLVVKAEDIDLEAGDALDAALTQRGLEELSKHRRVFSLDGEIPESDSYIYGVDYNLGDVVTQRDEDDFSNDMIVTEQIFASDLNGERAYPTLSLSNTINPGTWLSWAGNKTWAEIDPEVYWGNA